MLNFSDIFFFLLIKLEFPIGSNMWTLCSKNSSVQWRTIRTRLTQSKYVKSFLCWAPVMAEFVFTSCVLLNKLHLVDVPNPSLYCHIHLKSHFDVSKEIQALHFWGFASSGAFLSFKTQTSRRSLCWVGKENKRNWNDLSLQTTSMQLPCSHSHQPPVQRMSQDLLK